MSGERARVRHQAAEEVRRGEGEGVPGGPGELWLAETRSRDHLLISDWRRRQSAASSGRRTALSSPTPSATQARANAAATS